MPGRQLPPDKPHDWVKRTTLFDLEALPGATFGGQLRLHLEDIEDIVLFGRSSHDGSEHPGYGPGLLDLVGTLERHRAETPRLATRPQAR